jgi:hypothetical protein
VLPGHLRVMFPTEATPTHRETSQLEDLVRRRRGDIFVWLGICPGCADIVAREVNTGGKLRPCSKRWRIAVRKYDGRIVLPQDKEFHPQVEMGLSKIGGTLEPGEQRGDRTASGGVYLSKRRVGALGPRHEQRRGTGSTRAASSSNTSGIPRGSP